MVEFAGPERFRLDEILQRVMHASQDPREVVTDPSARYFGAPLSEGTLTPDEGAIIGVGTFDDWLRQSSTGAGGQSTSATHPSRRELLQEILRGGGKDVATTEHTV